MVPNTAFLIARRRNEHRRRASEFLTRLAERTGLGSDQVSLVDPARSVELEAAVYSHLREGLATGAITRHCHLPLSEALSRFREPLEALGNVDVDVLLCRTPDFSFRCRAPVVVQGAQSLLEFDGDTVTVVAEGNSAGAVIDVETEALGRMVYEVDQWGPAGSL